MARSAVRCRLQEGFFTTALALTAAAHIAPLCQYVDLDGPLLIENDPVIGVTYDAGRPLPSDRPGLGLLPRG